MNLMNDSVTSPVSIHTVLVRPKFSVNVGYASRAIANMGAKRLILIDPRCKLDQRAQEGAAGGFGPLSKATIYENWNEFLSAEGTGIRIGLTRRNGEHRVVEPLSEAVARMNQDSFFKDRKRDIYVVFGPEDHGLDAQDLSHTNWACSLPVFGEFQSMNLSQAVLLTLYILKSELKNLDTSEKASDLISTKEPYDFPEDLIRKWLVGLGFNLDLSTKKNAALRVSQMMARACPTFEETRLLKDILHQTLRKLELTQKTVSRSATDLSADTFDRTT